MLSSIIRFELRYRLRRPATWIYFALFLLIGVLAMTDGIRVGGAVGQVKKNAPTVLFYLINICTTVFGAFIISAIMGVPVLRDYEHKTEGLMFTTNLRKGPYLFGRFFGSMIIMVILATGLPIGLLIGSVMPWVEADRMAPINLWHYWQPFFVAVLPNLFFLGSLFFVIGSLTRKMMYVYVQGIAMVALYIITLTLAGQLETKWIAGYTDPFGVGAAQILTEYWTISAQNTQTVPLSGIVLANRLLWVGVGIGLLVTAYSVFRFRTAGTGSKKGKKAVKAPENAAKLALGALPRVTQTFGTGKTLSQIAALTRVYTREVVRSIPFIAIVLIGMVILFINAPYFDSMYGTHVYPKTAFVLELLQGSFNLFLMIIIIFFTGELIWRERDLNMNLIYDALPVPNYVGLLAKFAAMGVIMICLQGAMMASGILIQVFKGYFEFEIPVYLKGLFGTQLLGMMLSVAMAMVIQVLVNNKFAGFALVAGFFLATVFASDMGLEHSLFRFNSGSVGSYSDMNQYGHYVTTFGWLKLYWLGLAAALFTVAVTFSVRGTEVVLRTRAKLAGQQFSRPLLITVFGMVALFVGAGATIYYNDNVLHKWKNSDEVEKMQAEFEKTLKPKYDRFPQPKVVESNLKVEIYPESRDFEAEGFFILKNKTANPISDILIQHNASEEIVCESLTFDRPSKIKEAYKDYKFYVYALEKPLAPGDSMKMSFKIRFATDGFVTQGSSIEVLHNGTFFNSTMFPMLGYEEGNELSDDNDRRKQGLKPKERMPERNDPYYVHIPLLGDDADRIRFEMVVGTSGDQTALAPGYLAKQWQENGRNYFHYKMDAPMLNFYNVVSARYEVKKDVWKGKDGKEVALEIYYHPGHKYNLDRMMAAMKASFDYYTEAFGPYQYRQMRIMEFPRYRTFAQSFANTVPFSEGIGFVSNIASDDDVDMAFYVTAHEVAHQWWAHQVTEAEVKGNAMMSETLSQYSALMVMKKHYGPQMIQKFLSYELDRYLQGRADETKKEQPLVLVERQPYIHYRKGSLVMYALQDYIGEDSVNAALKRVVRDWAFREDRYITSDSLMAYYRAVTPDSLQPMLTDMFERITLFSNRVINPTAKKEGSSYRVTLPVESIKYHADSLGNEKEVPLHDWVDVGVYTEGKNGKDSLVYLRKYLVDKKNQTISVTVPQKPSRAGIDPINKLVDRNPEDNRASVAME